MTDKDQIKEIGRYCLTGVYINCSTPNCNAHDVEEAFPEDAPTLFFDKGWRIVDKAVLCPDCALKKSRHFDIELLREYIKKRCPENEPLLHDIYDFIAEWAARSPEYKWDPEKRVYTSTEDCWPDATFTDLIKQYKDHETKK